MPHRQLFLEKVNKKKLYQEFKEQGKLTEKRLHELPIWEWLAFWELFYEEIGVFVTFSKHNLVPRASPEFSWVICAPPNRMLFNAIRKKCLNNEDAHYENLLKVLSRIIDEEEPCVGKCYILRVQKLKTSKKSRVEKGEVATEGLNRGSYFTLKVFIYWLTGLHLNFDSQFL
jgi:hypothetical protein